MSRETVQWWKYTATASLSILATLLVNWTATEAKATRSEVEEIVERRSAPIAKSLDDTTAAVGVLQGQLGQVITTNARLQGKLEILLDILEKRAGDRSPHNPQR